MSYQKKKLTIELNYLKYGRAEFNNKNFLRKKIVADKLR